MLSILKSSKNLWRDLVNHRHIGKICVGKVQPTFTIESKLFSTGNITLNFFFRAVKDMIALVDEDRDGKISFREFLMIFRKQSEGEIQSDSGLDKLVKLTEIDVSATVIFRF